MNILEFLYGLDAARRALQIITGVSIRLEQIDEHIESNGWRGSAHPLLDGWRCGYVFRRHVEGEALFVYVSFELNGFSDYKSLPISEFDNEQNKNPINSALQACFRAIADNLEANAFKYEETAQRLREAAGRSAYKA